MTQRASVWVPDRSLPCGGYWALDRLVSPQRPSGKKLAELLRDVTAWRDLQKQEGVVHQDLPSGMACCCGLCLAIERAQEP